MMNRLSILWLMIFTVLAFSINSLGQSKEDFELTKKSLLAAIDLPTGAVRIKESSVPKEVKELLAHFVAEVNKKAKVRQGDSEVIGWSGYGSNKSKSTQLMTKVESNLREAGWEYEIFGKTDEKGKEVVVFSLTKSNPKRFLLGFFALKDDGVVFAVTEIILVDATKK